MGHSRRTRLLSYTFLRTFHSSSPFPLVPPCRVLERPDSRSTTDLICVNSDIGQAITHLPSRGRKHATRRSHFQNLPIGERVRVGWINFGPSHMSRPGRVALHLAPAFLVPPTATKLLPWLTLVFASNGCFLKPAFPGRNPKSKPGGLWGRGAFCAECNQPKKPKKKPSLGLLACQWRHRDIAGKMQNAISSCLMKGQA